MCSLQKVIGSEPGGISVAQLNRTMKTLRLHVLALTVAFLGLGSVADAGSLTLAWDGSPDPAVAGYRLYWGPCPARYTNSLDVRAATSVTVPNLADGRGVLFRRSRLQLGQYRKRPLHRGLAAHRCSAGRRRRLRWRLQERHHDISTLDGGWYFLRSATSFFGGAGYTWGAAGDKPVPGDYDGDSKIDIAVYRPSTGHWFILPSSSNFTTAQTYQWGTTGDQPVSGDYDGDGRTDLAIYRPRTVAGTS